MVGEKNKLLRQELVYNSPISKESIKNPVWEIVPRRLRKAHNWLQKVTCYEPLPQGYGDDRTGVVVSGNFSAYP